jgi:predicted component of type VI protein secretion system
MADDFLIGGNAVRVDASEGIADIPMNRTLFVQKLTDEDPGRPKAVYDLKTVDEVFAHFKPKVEVEFDTYEGSTSNEQIHFNNLGDFKASNIVSRSPFLQDLSNEKDDYQKLVKQLKNNKQLAGVINKPETKAAFINALQALIAELNQH